jgi:hypothetical protein
MPDSQRVTMTQLESWIVQACHASNLQVDLGFLAAVGDTRTVRSVARIRGLGAVNGMLILRNYDEADSCLNDVKQAGYGFSVLDEPGDDEAFDLQSFQDMFRDWGWSGPDA